MLLLSHRYHNFVRRQARPTVDWISPQANETLRAGQNYTAKWNSSSAKNPWFQLCTNETSCGDAVSTPLQSDGQAYFVSLTLPNITSSNPFVLMMHDETGNATSPPFFIVPEHSSMPAAGLSFDLHNPTPSDGPSLLIPAVPPPSASSGMHTPTSAPPGLSKRDFIPSIFPAHTPMYIIIAIVPLVLVTLGLAISIFLWVRQRRNSQLKRLYLTEHPMVYPRRPGMNKTLNSAEDIEYAVQELEEGRVRAAAAAASVRQREQDEEPERASRLMASRILRREKRDREEEEPKKSYVPEERNLTAFYLRPSPPPTLASLSFSGGGNLMGEDAPTYRPPSPSPLLARPPPPPPPARVPVPEPEPEHQPPVLGESERVVLSPESMTAFPEKSVTKLSERLHLRGRSKSADYIMEKSASRFHEDLDDDEFHEESLK